MKRRTGGFAALEILLLVGVLIALAAIGYFGYQSFQRAADKQAQLAKASPRPSVTATATPSPTAASIAPTQSPAGAPAKFSVTNVTVGGATLASVTDKLGGTHSVCRMTGTITASAAGTVNYYWDTYHPQYYNPSLKGEAQTVAFTGAGTKTVTLDTLSTNDARRFTIFVTSPNNKSAASETKVFCPAS